jgi:hypothetical protein
VTAYWDLDFGKWWSALTGSPKPAIAGARIRLLDRQGVSAQCTHRFEIRIPVVRPGKFPIEVLYGGGKSDASSGPVAFRVTTR